MKKTTITILLILFCILPDIISSNQMRIAIYDFQAKGISENTAQRVSDWIRTAMIGGRFIIVERSQMNTIFKEQGFQMTGCTDQECAVKIGKMLAANKILVGTVEKFYGKYLITGRLVDVEKGAAEFGHKEMTKDVSELDSLAEIFARNILRKISGSSEIKSEFYSSADNPHVMMKTSMGNIEIELFRDKSPLSVKNFLQYVDYKFYDNTIFHRVIPDFMIQGGGYMPGFKTKKAFSPISNEAHNGLSNTRGTISMARTQNIDSATSQFFINVANNTYLDHRDRSARGYGYAVFGRVIKGMNVVDRIRKVPTGIESKLRNVPKNDVIIYTIRRINKKE